LPDDLLMAKMHAVKKADGQADFAVAGFQVFGVADQFHWLFNHFVHMTRET
jgi:hypothetical protein